MFQYQLASLLARVGDREAWLQQCQKLLSKYAQTDRPEWSVRAAHVSLLLPIGGEVLSSASRLADRAIAQAGKQPVLTWAQVTAAMAAYRRGDFQTSVDCCDKALAKESDGVRYRNAQAYYLRAAALAGSGKIAIARMSLKKADAILEEIEADVKKNNWRDAWHDVAMCEILQKEVQPLFAETPKTQPKAPVRPARKP